MIELFKAIFMSMLKIGTCHVEEQACLSASDKSLSVNVSINFIPQSPPGKGPGLRTSAFLGNARESTFLPSNRVFFRF